MKIESYPVDSVIPPHSLLPAFKQPRPGLAVMLIFINSNSSHCFKTSWGKSSHRISPRYVAGTSLFLPSVLLLTGQLDVLRTNGSIQNALSLICLPVPCIQIIERGFQMVGALNRTHEKTRGDWGEREGSLPLSVSHRFFSSSIFRLRSTIWTPGTGYSSVDLFAQ